MKQVFLRKEHIEIETLKLIKTSNGKKLRNQPVYRLILDIQHWLEKGQVAYWVHITTDDPYIVFENAGDAVLFKLIWG